ncbi:DNA-binding response regulator [Limnohabitans sp. MORI2]|uniref:response regulator transcription factor n=1 Tax=Limnohabitans sp. MORI2 TaxID=1751150 RepID=UPI0023775992|nr:response regulator [Limnohabitans sp. MORI2]BDU57600.1 DNA-binding response regulator [Limnohabitans sp. MORI2]
MLESRLICVVDDDASVRDSLSIMLGLKGFDCRTYENSESFLGALPDRPCCVVLDLNMTGMNGLDLQEKISAAPVPMEVVFLTAFADVDVMRRAFLGQAVDFLEKPVVMPQLLNAIERAFERLKSSSAQRVHTQSLEMLTPREREVMVAIAQGMTHREAGELLGISPRTVEVHKGRVMEKLGVKTLAELVRLSIDSTK